MKKENGRGERLVRLSSALLLVTGLAGEIIYAAIALL